jgi:hypothetical protein
VQGELLDDGLDTNMVPLRLVDLLEKGTPVDTVAYILHQTSPRGTGTYPDCPPPPPISQHFASFLRACLNPTSSMSVATFECSSSKALSLSRTLYFSCTVAEDVLQAPVSRKAASARVD